MQGYNTLWVPGIDHAGIATQVVVEAGDTNRSSMPTKASSASPSSAAFAELMPPP